MDAVISFPKSGRTWLRVMLDQYGLPLEWSHAGGGHSKPLPIERLDTSEARAYGRILFLHRDPRDTVVSGYYQKKLRRHGYRGTMSDFIRDPLHGIEKVLHYNAMWIRLAQERPGMRVESYENLQADTEGTLARIVDFFGQTADAARIRDIVEANRFEKMQARERDGEYARTYGRKLTPGDPNNPDSYKVRKGKVGGYRDELSAQDIAWCDAAVASFAGTHGTHGAALP